MQRGAEDCPICERSHGSHSSCPGAGLGSRIGQVVGDKYRLVRLIGEGGMGSVYEAHHVLIGRRFAVKFPRASQGLNQRMLARFRREAETAGSFESENIAAATDFGFAHDGAPYIVMEHLVGDALSGVLEQSGPLPVQRAVGIAIQTCRGLDLTHTAGVIHRDLKPENLFICRMGDGADLVKVLDFGIAKLRDTKASSSTLTGTTMGTPSYMPPEQARGDKHIDHRADIYALGVILYECLSGEKPHPGESCNATLYHILTQQPAALDGLRPGLPKGLSEVVHKAMAFDPGDRFQSVAEFAKALLPYAGRTVAPINSHFALPVSPTEDTEPVATPEEGATAASSRPASGDRRLTRGLRMAVAIAVASIGLASWLTSSRGSKPVEAKVAPDPGAAREPRQTSISPPVAASVVSPAPPILAGEHSAESVASPPARERSRPTNEQATKASGQAVPISGHSGHGTGQTGHESRPPRATSPKAMPRGAPTTTPSLPSNLAAPTPTKEPAPVSFDTENPY